MWPIAEAKARLSEVIEKASEEGPQVLTKHGRPAAVLVSVEEWDRKTKRTGSLADFFAESPLPGSELDLHRLKDEPRDTRL